MIASTHTSCNQCADALHCAGIGYCLAGVEEKRRENRRLLDQLTPGQRLTLMFGAGKLDRETMTVVPLEHKLEPYSLTGSHRGLVCSCGFNVASADWDVALATMNEHLKKFA